MMEGGSVLPFRAVRSLLKDGYTLYRVVYHLEKQCYEMIFWSPADERQLTCKPSLLANQILRRLSPEVTYAP